ncbi:hypothetical protein T261_6551 [Streptomyces lydicus]|nr:hypothetical protein T261_6551 [Streptomyces lydicus]
MVRSRSSLTVPPLGSRPGRAPPRSTAAAGSIAILPLRPPTPKAAILPTCAGHRPAPGDMYG